MTEEKKPRRRANKNAIITVLAAVNPKRKGTRAWTRFALYEDGMTVAKYIEYGGRTGDVNHDVAEGYISVHMP
jgi:hypothetical protein